ncbi:MAG: tRNA lysidine(34) synthetase TilS [Verrucomicrobia bacterium]|nr:MAG: tRNA lysidine(34) synthetase TilS [Verrucomicrobiota bacterium]
MSNLVAAVEQSIRSQRLLRRGESVLVAVSGGLDSMTLLHVLHQLAAKHEWRLLVVHFNHRLRRADSDGDEQFVQAAVVKLGLRLIAGRADVAAFARREKLSVEMAARKLRHDFLARAARRLKIKTVALAHHADDQVELFFLRWLRGGGGKGLAGMKWANPSPSDPAVGLVRPLLDQSKAVLRRYAQEHGIAFREDATNAHLDFLRNRIRNKLLPLLSQKYQPALARSVLRTMDIVGAEADLVRRVAEEWLSQKRRSDFEKLHLAVQRQAIQIQLLKLGVAPDFDLTEQLRGSANQPVPVGPGLTVRRERGGRVVKEATVCPTFRPEQIAVELKGRDGAVDFGRLRIYWWIRSRKASLNRRPKFAKGCEYFDAERIGSSVVLRHWRAGDRIQPIGMKAPVKLQDLFVNQKISRAQRHQLVVATTAAGELFWVEGLRIGERFKLDNRTVYLLKWRWLVR